MGLCVADSTHPGLSRPGLSCWGDESVGSVGCMLRIGIADNCRMMVLIKDGLIEVGLVEDGMLGCGSWQCV